MDTVLACMTIGQTAALLRSYVGRLLRLGCKSATNGPELLRRTVWQGTVLIIRFGKLGHNSVAFWNVSLSQFKALALCRNLGGSDVNSS